MAIKRILSRLGSSWHDIFIVILLFETCWWGMFAFMDSADFVLRAISETSKTEYHLFVLVQKCFSVLKIIGVVIFLWYGVIYQGKGVYPRIYFFFGIFVDVTLLLSWILIASEEDWPLSPTNIFGVHYIVTFVLLRVMVYFALHCSLVDIFVSPFGPPVVGTVNGAVIGIPEHGDNRTINSSNNLSFLGKGIVAVLKYYRIEPANAFLVSVMWDTFWNWAVIFSQEIPEIAFNYVFVGLFGSLPLNISTDDFILRAIRVLLGVIAIFLVMKKVEVYVKIWIGVYGTIMLINIGLLCYLASSALIEETPIATIILLTVFIESNVAKLFVIYCALRFYMHLKKGNERLVTENNNNNYNTTT